MDFSHKRFAIVAAVAVIASALMAAALAKVTKPTVKAEPAGVSIAAKPIRVIEITKADRLDVGLAGLSTKPPEPPVRVASVEPEAPVVAEPEPQVHRVRRPRYSESGDICARHHMRRVTVGRGWRCR